MRLTAEFAQRFWSKVLRDEECWVWTGARIPEGYGSVGIPGRSQVGAHRVAWALANGRWPKPGYLICHTCDNPLCVNPEHLYEGTPRDNARDAVERGRKPHGEGHANHKVTDMEVLEIRRRYGSGESQTSIAEDYPITQAQVSNIVRGTQRRRIKEHAYA